MKLAFLIVNMYILHAQCTRNPYACCHSDFWWHLPLNGKRTTVKIFQMGRSNRSTLLMELSIPSKYFQTHFFPRMSSVAMICCCNAAIMEDASNWLDPILSYPYPPAGYLSASAYHCLNVSFVRDVNCGSCVAKCMFPPWFYAVPHGPLLFPWDSIVGRLSLRHAEARVSHAKTALPQTALLLGLFCAWANNCRRPAYSGHQGRV